MRLAEPVTVNKLILLHTSLGTSPRQRLDVAASI